MVFIHTLVIVIIDPKAKKRKKKKTLTIRFKNKKLCLLEKWSFLVVVEKMLKWLKEHTGNYQQTNSCAAAI